MTPEARNYYRELGKRLQWLRAALQLTEAQAAADHGVTLPTYRRWEAGGRIRGKYQALSNFCKKHKVSYEFYFAGQKPAFSTTSGRA